MCTEQLLNDFYTFDGGRFRFVNIRAVAMHPETQMELMANAPPEACPSPPTFMGLPIKVTTNVAKRRLRIIPKGTLEFYEHPDGHPCAWPLPSVESGKIGLGNVSFVSEKGELFEATRCT